MKPGILFFTLFFTGISVVTAQTTFKIIPLGVKGGGDESNLSCYMIAAAGTEDYVCLDAGTVYVGLQKAIGNHILKGEPDELLRKNIKGWLISHGHLDHVAGLVLNSPDDSNKNIYMMSYTKQILQEKYFTQGSWSNFSDEGEKALNKYHYVTLDSAKEIPLAQTTMYVTAFPLSHGNPYKSTAFLVRQNDSYILYLGDTGADAIEHSDDLHMLWQYITPLLKDKKLKAIFIECSFPDGQPDQKLFGHLNPHLLMKEMDKLALEAGAASLINLPVIITHIKPAGNHEAQIIKQLATQNHLQLKIVFAKQGRELLF